MDYSAKSKLSLITSHVCRDVLSDSLCGGAPRTVESTLCMKNYVPRRNLFKSCPETKIDNFQDKARKSFVF